jgi:hypothetical protein
LVFYNLQYKEEHRLKKYKNRVLTISGTKRDEVKGNWKKTA